MKRFGRYFFLLMLIALIGCSQKPQQFPDQTAFTIEATISNLTPTPGEEVWAHAKFKNHSPYPYEIERGSDLIRIIHWKPDESNIIMAIADTARRDKLKANRDYTRSKAIVFDGPGKYEVRIEALFRIKLNGAYKSYEVKTEPFILEVKDSEMAEEA